LTSVKKKKKPSPEIKEPVAKAEKIGGDCAESGFPPVPSFSFGGIPPVGSKLFAISSLLACFAALLFPTKSEGFVLAQ